MGSHDERSEEWWAHQDSNLGRAGYEPAALTAELWAPVVVRSDCAMSPRLWGRADGQARRPRLASTGVFDTNRVLTY